MIFRFGWFELDSDAAELRRKGRVLPIQEQPLVVLEALLEHPGDVVDRETLRRRLWPDGRAVDVDGGINAAVRRLREVLDDSASNPRFVATVPRRGYRFVAPVEKVPAEDPPEEKASAITPATPETFANPETSRPEASKSPRALGAAALWILGLALGLALTGWMLLRSGSSGPPPPNGSGASEAVRLVVLPFVQHGTSEESAFLGDALAEELGIRLGRLDPDRLRVLGRTSARALGPSPDLDEVERRLGVDYVLEGSVRQEDDRLRIHVALVEIRGRSQQWSRTFDRRLGALLPLEREIADQVARSLAVELEVAGSSSALEGRAHALYLEGRYFQGRLTAESLDRAEAAFLAAASEAASSGHPEAAAPYAGLAEVWILRGLQDYVPTSEAFPKARAAAREALERDPDSPAVVAVALSEHLWEWNPLAAAPLYARALELDPASPSTLLFVSAFESDRGRHDRAVQLAEGAVELDPLSPVVHTELCRRLFRARRHDEAVERCRRAIDLDPSFLQAWDVLKWIHIHRRDEARAIETFLRVVELEELHKDALPSLRRTAEEGGLDGLLRRSLDNPAGRLAESGQSPYNLALDEAALGRVDAAVEWLDRAFLARETDLAGLEVDPRLDPLRQDPRFRELVRRIASGGKPPGAPGSLEDPL